MRWYFDTYWLVMRFEDNSLTITSLEVSMLIITLILNHFKGNVA